MADLQNSESKPPADARPVGAWRRLRNLLGPFVALAAVVLLFAVSDWLMNEKTSFLTGRNLTTVTAQTAIVAVAALGMTILIIAGGIDLSAGTAIALCATVLAWSLKEEPLTKFVAGDSTLTVAARIKESQAKVKKIQSDIEKLAGDSGNKLQLPTLLHELGSANSAVDQLEGRLPLLRNVSLAIGVLLAVGCGCLCGFVNGALVSGLKVVPFIVTLGTMQLYLGIAKQVAHETTVRPDVALQVPDWFVTLLSVRPEALWFGLPNGLRVFGITVLPRDVWLGLPSGVWLTLLLAALLAAVLRWTVFSRYVFALGSNEATARLCGINVFWNKIAVYTLSGLFVGIAGLYQFSRLSVGNPSSGTGLELKIIAAVVIGGGSLSGGRGTVVGTLTGALIMSVITSGCTMLGLQNPVQDMILGVIIVAAVTLDQFRQKQVT